MCTDVCEQPKKIGPCKARIPRFYFNSTYGKCKEFGWGGCDPNENNFKTKEECEKICIGISQWQNIYDKFLHFNIESNTIKYLFDFQTIRFKCNWEYGYDVFKRRTKIASNTTTTKKTTTSTTKGNIKI